MAQPTGVELKVLSNSAEVLAQEHIASKLPTHASLLGKAVTTVNSGDHKNLKIAGVALAAIAALALIGVGIASLHGAGLLSHTLAMGAVITGTIPFAALAVIAAYDGIMKLSVEQTKKQAEAKIAAAEKNIGNLNLPYEALGDATHSQHQSLVSKHIGTSGNAHSGQVTQQALAHKKALDNAASEIVKIMDLAKDENEAAAIADVYVNNAAKEGSPAASLAPTFRENLRKAIAYKYVETRLEKLDTDFINPDKPLEKAHVTEAVGYAARVTGTSEEELKTAVLTSISDRFNRSVFGQKLVNSAKAAKAEIDRLVNPELIKADHAKDVAAAQSAIDTLAAEQNKKLAEYAEIKRELTQLLSSSKLIFKGLGSERTPTVEDVQALGTDGVARYTKAEALRLKLRSMAVGLFQNNVKLVALKEKVQSGTVLKVYARQRIDQAKVIAHRMNSLVEEYITNEPEKNSLISNSPVSAEVNFNEIYKDDLSDEARATQALGVIRAKEARRATDMYDALEIAPIAKLVVLEELHNKIASAPRQLDRKSINFTHFTGGQSAAQLKTVVDDGQRAQANLVFGYVNNLSEDGKNKFYHRVGEINVADQDETVPGEKAEVSRKDRKADSRAWFLGDAHRMGAPVIAGLHHVINPEAAEAPKVAPVAKPEAVAPVPV